MQDDAGLVEVIERALDDAGIPSGDARLVAPCVVAAIEAAGWVAVPREPTEALLKAEPEWSTHVRAAWKAMLSAAPKQT